MLKKIFKSSIIAFINALISIIAIPIVLAFVGIEGVGYYGMLLTLSSILSFLDFGSGKYLMTILPQNKFDGKNDERISLIFLVEFFLIAIFILVIFVSLFKVFPIQIFFIITISLFKVLEQFYRFVLIGLNKLNQIEIQSLVANILRWLLLILIGSYFEISSNFLIGWLFIVQFVNILIWRIHIIKSLQFSKKILNTGLNYAFSNFKILSNITYNQIIKIFNTQADKLLLLSFMGIKQFGVYTSILIIPNLAVAYSEVINNSVRVSIGNLISVKNKDATMKFYSILKYIIVLSFIGLLMLSFFPGYFSTFLYQDVEVNDIFLKLIYPILVASFIRLAIALVMNYFFLINDLFQTNILQTIISIAIIISYFIIRENMTISKLLVIQNVSNLFLLFCLVAVIFNKSKDLKS